MIRYFKFICKLLLHPLYLLSKTIPRDDNKWVFGTHFASFSGNTKYLFLELVEKHSEVNAIWIANSKQEFGRLRKLGFKSYMWYSPLGLYHSFTAGIHCYTANPSDTNRYAANGAFRVYLGHGIGIKKTKWRKPAIEWEKELGFPFDSFMVKIDLFCVLFMPPNVCLVTSAQQEWSYSLTFRIPSDQCIKGNYPRNKILSWSKSRLKTFIKRYESEDATHFIESLTHYKKVHIYMPTWRNDGNDFIKISHIDFQKLEEILVATDSAFILKLHPLTKLDVSTVKKYPHIFLFDGRFDVYTILPFTDCLITDYSSIYTDYLLMNKEIILFPFDMEKYLKNSYNLDDYDKYYPGRRVFTFNELIALIANGTDCHLQAKDYKHIMNTFWDSYNNGLDLVTEITKRVKSNSKQQ